MFLFPVLALSEELLITNSNVDLVLRRSFQIPVFLMVYSSGCGACLDVFPIWQTVMTKYAQIPGIIIASVDVVTEPEAAHLIFPRGGYPVFVQLIRGNATELSVTRTFEAFCERADQIRKLSGSPHCQLFSRDIPLIYPMFVLATPGNFSRTCDALRQACTTGNSDLRSCFLSPWNSNGLSLTIAYARDWNFTIENVPLQSLGKLISDYSREPFGGWDLRTSVTSERRLAILVYSEAYQLLDVKSIAKSQAEHFLMGRMTFSEFEALVGERNANREDAPLLLVSDLRRRKAVVWRKLAAKKKVIADLQLLREGKFDSEMAFRLDRIQGRSGRVWYVVGFVFVTTLFGFAFLWVCRSRRNCQKQE
jgi:thiol-disulfide isomerase/thioredoxin